MNTRYWLRLDNQLFHWLMANASLTGCRRKGFVGLKDTSNALHFFCRNDFWQYLLNRISWKHRHTDVSCKHLLPYRKQEHSLRCFMTNIVCLGAFILYLFLPIYLSNWYIQGAYGSFDFLPSISGLFFQLLSGPSWILLRLPNKFLNQL